MWVVTCFRDWGNDGDFGRAENSIFGIERCQADVLEAGGTQPRTARPSVATSTLPRFQLGEPIRVMGFSFLTGRVESLRTGRRRPGAVRPSLSLMPGVATVPPSLWVEALINTILHRFRIVEKILSPLLAADNGVANRR
jgi:hypothetical protein